MGNYRTYFLVLFLPNGSEITRGQRICISKVISRCKFFNGGSIVCFGVICHPAKEIFSSKNFHRNVDDSKYTAKKIPPSPTIATITAPIYLLERPSPQASRSLWRPSTRKPFLNSYYVSNLLTKCQIHPYLEQKKIIIINYRRWKKNYKSIKIVKKIFNNKILKNVLTECKKLQRTNDIDLRHVLNRAKLSYSMGQRREGKKKSKNNWKKSTI